MISQISSISSQLSVLSKAIASIHDEMKHLFNFQDVLGTLLFRLDGRVITSFYETGTSSSILSILKWVKNIVSKTKLELRYGAKSIKYDRQIREKESIPVYFYRTGASSILVVMLNSRANTGLMEIEMSRTAKRLGMIIDKKQSMDENL
ncbi:MAG: hypothetical protein ACXAB2_04320 [Candidatus Hodarchaeales archaeon]|jgi:hypothetical protein